RLETINCLYFFPFLIGASVIADGNLKDATLLLCQFRRQFWLDAKTIAANGQCFDKRSEDDLVAGLHIGQIQISQHIGNRGEHTIRYAMPEIEDTAALSGEKSRAIDYIGFAFENGGEQFCIFIWIIFKIGVL